MENSLVSENVLFVVIGTLAGIISTMFFMMRKDKREDTQKIIELTIKSTEAIINNNILTKQSVDAMRENTNFLIAIKTIFETTKQKV